MNDDDDEEREKDEDEECWHQNDCRKPTQMSLKFLISLLKHSLTRNKVANSQRSKNGFDTTPQQHGIRSIDIFL